MTYILNTKVGIVKGNVFAAANEAGRLHERNLMTQVRGAVARFYGVSAEIADRNKLIEFVPGTPISIMRDRKSKRELITLDKSSIREEGNYLIISTAYKTWDGKK